MPTEQYPNGKVNNELYEKNQNVADAPFWVVVSWHYVSAIFLQNSWLPFSSFKCFLLRLFGAKIGKGVVIKPCVTIKFPWKLTIGHYAWIGEQVWIDNLAQVTIAEHATISQGALLLTGNHNYKKKTSTSLSSK